MFPSFHKPTWQDDARSLLEFHTKRVIEHRESELPWTLQHTASELNRSLGDISETLRLALAMLDEGIGREVGSKRRKTDALEIVRRKFHIHLRTHNWGNGNGIK